MLKGKKILVAGGTGLIGTNLTKRLKEIDVDVRSSYCSSRPSLGPESYERYDFTRFEDCLRATREVQSVFICATHSWGVQGATENSTAWILPNLKIYAGLLEAAKINKVEKAVFISSSTAYPESSHPLREEDLDWNQDPYPLYHGIGWLNRYVEKLCQFYGQTNRLKTGVVRATNVYGPYDHFDDEKSHVLPALIRKALKKERPYVVWGDGREVRDFIYVDDFVSDILDILDRYCVCEPVNIGSGTATTIRDAVKAVLEVCQHPVEAQYDVEKPSAIPYRVLNLDKFRSLFGEKPRVPLAEGIQKTVEWYQSHS